MILHIISLRLRRYCLFPLSGRRCCSRAESRAQTAARAAVALTMCSNPGGPKPSKAPKLNEKNEKNEKLLMKHDETFEYLRIFD